VFAASGCRACILTTTWAGVDAGGTAELSKATVGEDLLALTMTTRRFTVGTTSLGLNTKLLFIYLFIYLFIIIIIFF
jgi:hypothetical protein